MVIARISRVGAFLAGLLIAVALLVTLAAPLAYAGRSICRTDPIVTLSDGHVLTLYADIAADLENVQSATYFLHIPPGVTVVSVEHPIAATAALEKFAYASDGSNKYYSATTVVTLRDGTTTDVIAYMDAVSPLKGKLRSASTAGQTDEPIVTTVKIDKK